MSFYTFDVIQQLSSILRNTNYLHLSSCSNAMPNSNLPMRDIVDGAFYRHVLDRETGQCLTLTMSTDGVQPYNNSDKGIWPVTFVVNEIERKRRFFFENLIIGGVWPGPKKPKREEMFAFLDIIVQQLKELETGRFFECRSNSGPIRQFLNVFLICCCMDKPAQALVQNLAEPTAKYGCGRCELRGEEHVHRLQRTVIRRCFCLGCSVRSSDDSHHRINCFPIDISTIQPHGRSNERYDHLLALKQRNDDELDRIRSGPLDRTSKRDLKKKCLENKEMEHGIAGECVLRQLKYFDVGFSFVSDSLHNIYHGAFVSNQSCRQ